jgi:formylglycine-generating enzyme required for sulfatase activity
MGSPTWQGYDRERPKHSVNVPSFLMGKYPITQAQWKAIASLPEVEIELNRPDLFQRGRQRPPKIKQNRIAW